MNRKDEPNERSRLHELLYSLETEEISKVEFGELQEILRDKPELQKVYLTHVDLVLEVPALVGCHSLGMSAPDTAATRLAVHYS